MSRNLYIMSAVLLVLAGLSLGMSWISGAHQTALPGVTMMWRMMALILFLLGAISCLSGTVTNLFEQVSRRHAQRQARKNHGLS